MRRLIPLPPCPCSSLAPAVTTPLYSTTVSKALRTALGGSLDADTGAQVAGTVIIDPPGTTSPPQLQFNTNTPFTVTFNCIAAGGMQDEWVCTTGRVTAPGYAPFDIPFDVAEPY